MKSNILPLILLVLFPLLGSAQSIERSLVASASREGSNSGIAYSYSVGEAVIGELSNGSTLNQGFQQEFDIATSITEPGIQISLFPNPALNSVRIDPGTNLMYSYSLYSSDGKLLQQGMATGAFDLEMESYVPGAYLIEINPTLTNQILRNTLIKR